MAINTINTVKSLIVPITAQSGANVVPIYQNSDFHSGSPYQSNSTIVSYNTYIKNLKVFASIQSVTEAALPDFSIDDSQTDKLTKVLNIEWTSPRKQLDVLFANASTNYQKIGSISLLNAYGYPFRVYSLMDFFTDNLAIELGENSKIAVQIVDVGYGLLTAQDTVTIYGSYVEEIIASTPDPSPVTIIQYAATTTVADTLIGNSELIDNQFLIGN